MQCEVCGAPAEVHVTILDEGAPEEDRYTEQQLCSACAQKLMPDLPVPKPTDALPQLRALLGWIKTNNRLPLGADYGLLGGAGDLSAAQPDTKEFAEQVGYFEALITFLEKHARFPTEGELPDPFLPPPEGA
jgi:hypothetical protein